MLRTLMIVGILAATTLGGPVPAQAGGGCNRDVQTYGSGAVVELREACMSPGVLRTDQGTKVTFVNRDAMIHNVFGEGWGRDKLVFGASYERTFDVAGTYAFVCTIHPGMVGAVVVGDGLGAEPVSIGDRAAAAPAAASTSRPQPERTTSNELPLGLALGAFAGVAGTLGARRVRLSR